jgi:hypothetical protein
MRAFRGAVRRLIVDDKDLDPATIRLREDRPYGALQQFSAVTSGATKET